MSRITSALLELLPDSWQQRVRNKYYERKISNATPDDESDLVMVQHLVREGQTAIDIGANFGMYTRFLSEYTGTSGTVIAFEPIQRTFLSLRHNVDQLKLDNVEVYPFALSDREARVIMNIPDYPEGGENLYEAKISRGTRGKHVEAVQTRVLDEFLSDRSVHFMKIDAEGHEPHVLKGALVTLEKSRPVLLIEINGGISATNRAARDVVDLLGTLEYRPYRHVQEKLRQVEGEDDGVNYFFLNPEHELQFEAYLEDR